MFCFIQIFGYNIESWWFMMDNNGFHVYMFVFKCILYSFVSNDICTNNKCVFTSFFLYRIFNIVGIRIFCWAIVFRLKCAQNTKKRGYKFPRRNIQPSESTKATKLFTYMEKTSKNTENLSQFKNFICTKVCVCAILYGFIVHTMTQTHCLYSDHIWKHDKKLLVEFRCYAIKISFWRKYLIIYFPIQSIKFV